MKKILTFILAVSIMLSTFPVGVFAQPELVGTGLPDNPYMIGTEEDLLLMAEKINDGDSDYSGDKYYILTGDIVLTDPSEGESNFPMISVFEGVIDGQGHTIENMVLNTKDTVHTGFICDNYGTVENVNFANARITATGADTGSQNGNGAVVVGYARNSSVVSGCTVSGTVTVTGTGKREIRGAGIVSENGAPNSTAVVSDCSFTGNITIDNSSNAYLMGGICAYNGGWVERCLTANTELCGINTGTKTKSMGLLGGHSNGAKYIGNAVYQSSIRTPENGASTGSVFSTSNPNIIYNNIVDESVTVYIGASDAEGSPLKDCDLTSNWSGQLSEEDVNYVSTDAFKDINVFSEIGWDFENRWEIDAETGLPKPKYTPITFAGDGTDESPYLIERKEQLYNLIDRLNAGDIKYTGCSYRLMFSPELDSSFHSIRNFDGILDGRGNKITGLNIKERIKPVDAYCGGFIRELSGKVQNLAIENGSLCVESNYPASGSGSAALLAGEMTENAEISSCKVTGVVTVDENLERVGGLAGTSQGGFLHDNFFSGSVSGGQLVGGLLGYGRNSISEKGAVVERNIAMGDITVVRNMEGTGGKKAAGLICAYFSGNTQMNANAAYDGIFSYYGTLITSAGGSGVGSIYGNTNQTDGKNSKYDPVVFDNNIAGDDIMLQRKDDGSEAYKLSSIEGHLPTISVSVKTGEEIQKQETYENIGWDFENRWTMDTDSEKNISYPVPRYDGLGVEAPSEPSQPGEPTDPEQPEEPSDPNAVVGNGSLGNPYQIRTPENLVFFAQKMNDGDEDYIGKNYLLLHNIDLTGYAYPTINNFTGLIDGRGHKITGLVITDEQMSGDTGWRGGFIKYNAGMIRDLVIENAYVQISAAFGDTASGVGLLVGESGNGSSIIGCTVTGTVTTPEGLERVGGVAGTVNGAIVRDCFFKGEVHGGRLVGGIAGYAPNKSTIERCIAMGKISVARSMDGDGNKAGAMIVAYHSGTPYLNGNVAYGGKISYNGDLASLTKNSGVGSIFGNTNSTSSFNNNIASTNLILEQADCVPPLEYPITSHSKDIENSIEKKTPEELKKQETYENIGWNFEKRWKMDNVNGYPVLNYENSDSETETILGEGTARNPYQIDSEQKLLYFAEKLNSNDPNCVAKHFALTKDITLTEEFTPIETFGGVLDGRGHTIYNLRITDTQTSSLPGSYKLAFIKRLDGGKVKNLYFEDAKITVTGSSSGTGSSAAVIAAWLGNNASITGCKVTGTMDGFNGIEKAGGIAACIDAENGGTITDCFFKGTVKGKYMPAGIISYANNGNVIERCIAMGDIAVNNAGGTDGRRGTDAGLIVAYPGDPVPSIRSCAAYSGNISYSGKTEGFVGRIYGYSGYRPDVIGNIASSAITVGGNVVTGIDTDQNGRDFSPEDMKKQETYENIGWDFESKWTMDEVNGWPVPMYTAPAASVEKITISVNGNMKTSRGFTWYVPEQSQVTSVLELSTSSNMSDAMQINPEVELVNEEYCYRASVKGLIPGTKYYYQIKYTSGGKENKSAVYSFTTEPEEKKPFTFINVADTEISSTNGDTVSRLLEKAAEFVPDAAFLLHNGDFTSKGSNEDLWTELLDGGSKSLRNITVVPVAGEKDTAGSMVNHFNIDAPLQDTRDGAYYSFDYSNTHFTVLNTNDGENGISDSQLKWMRDDIQDAKAAGARWLILALHKGPYITGSHTNDSDITAIRNKLLPVVNELGIDLVLQGHDHIYVRTKYLGSENLVTEPQFTELWNGKRIDYVLDGNGTFYMTAGPAGTNAGKQQVSSEYISKYFERSDESGARNMGQMFATVTIDSDRLTVRNYKMLGTDDPTMVEGFGIDKRILEVENMISSLSDAQSVKEARKAYDQLSSVRKAQVSNYSLLEEKEKQLLPADKWMDAAAQQRQANLELKEVYFKGCMDCVGYLKKLNML